MRTWHEIKATNKYLFFITKFVLNMMNVHESWTMYAMVKVWSREDIGQPNQFQHNLQIKCSNLCEDQQFSL